jgi:hypothetical protein
MAVQLIKIGNVANDGTGDDLREAFIKVNQNFEDLDLRNDENTSASNLGDIGEGLFVRRNVYDLEFKKISAGANVTLTADDNKIVIAADSGVSDLTITADAGSVLLDNSAALTISGGSDITTSIVEGVLTVDYVGITDLVSDPTPQLSADLDAQSNNLLNVGTISSSGISGPLTGNVTGDVVGSVFGDDSTPIVDAVNNTLNGNLTGNVTGNVTGDVTGNVTGLVHSVDIRDLNFYKLPENSWNFGELGQETVITNIFDYVFAATDVDFGLLTSATPVDLDFASF